MKTDAQALRSAKFLMWFSPPMMIGLAIFLWFEFEGGIFALITVVAIAVIIVAEVFVARMIIRQVNARLQKQNEGNVIIE